MQQDFLSILISSISGTTLTAIVAFLCKNVISERLKNAIQHEYDQKLELHKKQTQIDIANLNSQLAIAQHERNIRNTRVYEKTAETLAEVYDAIGAYKFSVDNYIRLAEKCTPEEYNKLINLINLSGATFLQTFLRKKIYIPKETANKIKTFADTITQMQHDYDKFLVISKMNPSNIEEIEKQTNKLGEMLFTVPIPLSELEDEFQDLLGMKPTKYHPLQHQF